MKTLDERIKEITRKYGNPELGGIHGHSTLFEDIKQLIEEERKEAQEQMTLCPACSGQGVVWVDYIMTTEPHQDQELCLMCDGKGVVDKEKSQEYIDSLNRVAESNIKYLDDEELPF